MPIPQTAKQLEQSQDRGFACQERKTSSEASTYWRLLTSLGLRNVRIAIICKARELYFLTCSSGLTRVKPCFAKARFLFPGGK
jgi:hypothetical protein